MRPLRSALSRGGPTGRRRRSTWGFVSALLLLQPLLIAGCATPSQASSALSGAYNGSGQVSDAAAFDSWRGKKQTVVMDFAPSDDWAALSNPTWLANAWQGKGYVLALSVPMLPQTGGSIQTGATGAYNGYFRTLGNLLVSRGLDDTIVRLGWEMNGTWFPWSAASDPGAYVRYWQQVVSTMRSVPGSSFRFDWSPQLGQGASGFNPASAYPGDPYVDIIGTSFYDQDWRYSSDQVQNRWDNERTMPYGLDWQASFASSHGKPQAFGEWGLSRRCDGRGGNDNPYYVQQMANWITNHWYAYETYFDHDTSSCERHAMTTGAFPNASATYRSLWGPATTTTTATTTAGTLDASVLRVSWNQDRSDDLSLNWRGVFGKVYVFLDPSVSATRVRFYLDDPSMSRTPLGVEAYAPYDLLGGAVDAATPWEVTSLLPGTHTLTAAVETSSGTKVAKASFLR